METRLGKSAKFDGAGVYSARIAAFDRQSSSPSLNSMSRWLDGQLL